MSSRQMAADFIQAPTSHCQEGPDSLSDLLTRVIDFILNCASSVCFLQGKFIRINFDVAGYIVGANIETCILIPGLKVFE